MSELTPADRRAAEWECSRLVNSYANLMDAGKWDEVAALFALDGRMARPSDPDAFICGRAEILRAFRARPPRSTRHICANIVIQVESSVLAVGESAMLLFTGPSLPLVGSFHDRFVRAEQGWRFAERRGLLHFSG